MNFRFSNTIQSLWRIVLLAGILILLSRNAVDTVAAQAMPTTTNGVNAGDEVTIVGGQDADPGEYPWQALVYIGAGPFCGGALIAPQWVLSAAHCVQNATADQVRVVLGVHNAEQKDDPYRQEFVAQRLIIHPEFLQDGGGVLHNDIALIELPTPATLNARVAVIPFAQASDTALTAPGVMATVTGWGSQRDATGPYPAILQELALPIVSRAQCNQPTAYNGSVTERMLCTGLVQGGQGFCHGDSGGPLAVPVGQGQWKVIGVVSWFVPPCAAAEHYSVYTAVAGYASWLQQYLPTEAAEPLRNGDFEQGRNGDWQEYSSRDEVLIYSGNQAYRGNYFAWLGGLTNEISTLTQEVTLPNEQPLLLTFAYRIFSLESICSRQRDFVHILINNTIWRTATLCVGQNGGWRQAAIDLSPFAGQTIDLQFYSYNNRTRYSSFFLDEVAIGAQSYSNRQEQLYVTADEAVFAEPLVLEESDDASNPESMLPSERQENKMRNLHIFIPLVAKHQ